MSCTKCGSSYHLASQCETPAAPPLGESGEEHARKRAEYDAMFVKPAPQSADERRDAAADMYASNCNGLVDPAEFYAFCAGWDAAIEYVRSKK